ncbi:hypothetical protein VTK26DRAFT_6462 [Humicola hyalothermophila]
MWDICQECPLHNKWDKTCTLDSATSIASAGRAHSYRHFTAGWPKDDALAFKSTPTGARRAAEKFLEQVVRLPDGTDCGFAHVVGRIPPHETGNPLSNETMEERGGRQPSATGGQMRVLLLQRAAHDGFPLKYECPGGNVELGVDATILDALCREFKISSFLLALSAISATAETRGITPHEQYSSSLGVLGCKINTNRVAYWPGSVDCNNICVRVTYNSRVVDLLRIYQSGDAYNYLITGHSARDNPITGGAVNMDIQNVPAENCLQHLHTGNLPLSAPNSVNFVSSCLTSQPNSWVAQRHQLFNINDPVCHYGYDELCSLNLAVSNQPSCPHQLGTGPRLPDTVFNIQYGTGAAIPA